MEGASGRWLARLPQEDFCQATGTPAAFKYESDGRPGIERILGLLATSEAPQADRRTFSSRTALLDAARARWPRQELIRPGGAYRLTPLYDVMSAWPLIGEGPGLLSEHKLKMAMEIRLANALEDEGNPSQPLLSLGKRFGVLDDEGRGMEAIIDKTRRVVADIESTLPPGFPKHVGDAVLRGLERAAMQLAAGPRHVGL